MEKIKVKDNRLYSMAFFYDLHTKMFNNAIEGISDKDAHNRLNTKATHVAWIAGSVVNGRYELANAIGIDLKQTSPQFFQGFKSIQDGATYPPLEEYRKDWEIISATLRDALINLPAEKLDEDDPMGMSEEGGEKYTLYDTIGFLVDRESYCIGQIGLYRRLLGYDAMKYT